jgi:hypothetical protein
MKPMHSCLLFGLSLSLLGMGGLAAEKSAGGHQVLISGCGLGHVSLVAADGTVRWTIPEPREVEDAWLLPEKCVVYTHKDGVRCLRPDFVSGKGGNEVWSWKVPAGGEIHGCQPLPDGAFLFGVSLKDVACLIEVTIAGSGEVRERFRLTLKGLGGPHSTFRQVRKTPQGTYLVTQQRGGGVAMEFAADGTRLRTFPDGRFVAERLANGNTLIACGDNHRIIEVDPKGTVVWEVKQHDVPGLAIGFAAGIERLANGNTILCNWGGHGGASGAAVVEITRDKRTVWQLPGGFPGRVSNIHVLDSMVIP